MTIKLIEITDTEDGGANIVLDMSPELVLHFAKIGFMAAIMDKVEEVEKLLEDHEAQNDTPKAP